MLLGVLVFWRYSQIPTFGPFEVRGIVAGTMTLALLAMAQTVIVISGGIGATMRLLMRKSREGTTKVRIGPLTLIDPEEVSFDPEKQRRVVRVRVTSNLGEEVIFYTVEWQDRRKSLFQIRFLDQQP